MNLQSKKLLITGITGFIGSRLAELAIARGMQVRGLARSPQKAQPLKDRGIEIIVGDITDPGAAIAACEGMDIVLHTAALVKMDGDPADFYAVNRQGSLNMATAAKQQGVQTFVHLSTTLVYGFNYPKFATESSPKRGENNHYCQTKIDSEADLLALNHPPEFGIILIRPGDVYGANSDAWVVKPVKYMHRKEFVLPRLGNAYINHVYIDNLADAIFLAMEQQPYGEAFNITDGVSTTCKDYFTRLATIANAPPPVLLPTFVVQSLLRLRIEDQKKKGLPIDFPPDSIHWLDRPHPYSIAKAQQQLGYQPKVSLEEGLQRVKQWLQTADL
jgi:nucleoside-diphosphate-sugar epimerase